MSLSSQAIFDVYVAQSQNVRELGRNRKRLLKDLNWSLLREDAAIVRMKAKMFALLYSAWSEAQFVQILHTPNGFAGSEIRKIARTRAKEGIASGWDAMLAAAIRRVGNPLFNKDLRKREKDLKDAVKEYIRIPSELRNKIAHGQWVVALNRDNTAINADITAGLNALDYVRIEVMFEVHQHLGSIVRDLLQSPKKAFHRDYWTHMVDLDSFRARSKDWSMATKKNELSKKPRPAKVGPE